MDFGKFRGGHSPPLNFTQITRDDLFRNQSPRVLVYRLYDGRVKQIVGGQNILSRRGREKPCGRICLSVAQAQVSHPGQLKQAPHDVYKTACVRRGPLLIAQTVFG